MVFRAVAYFIDLAAANRNQIDARAVSSDII